MSLTTTDLQDILESLQNCSTQQLLDINAASARLYKAKRAVEGAQKMATLRVGQRVILSGVNKPQYLHRQLATVEEIRQSRITVKLDRGPMGKFKNGRVILNPALVTVLKNQPTDI